MHTLLNGEDIVIIFFTAEFCDEAILAAGKVYTVFVFGKGAFDILKRMRFVINT